MKTFVKVTAIYDGSGKSAIRPFSFDINTTTDSLTIAEIKDAAKNQFKKIDSADSILSEKVRFAGKDDYSDETNVLETLGQNSVVEYEMIIPMPEKSRSRENAARFTTATPRQLGN